MTIIPAVVAATADQKSYFRSNGQHSKLYLAFPQPAIIFKAHINDLYIGKDQVVFVTYDGVDTGAYTDIVPGMTLLVGTNEGGYDLGLARIRKAATSTKLFIGETSEVKFADNMHLTVIDEYGLWAKHKYVRSGSTHEDFMDFDIAYTDQHEDLDPVPILGPDRVLFYQGTLGGANTISSVFDASASYCLGSSVSTWAWTYAGSSAHSGEATDTLTVTYNAPGTYRISLTITAANGASFTGYRTIVVFDDTALPVSDFRLNTCNGDFQTGGWNFKVSMYDNADLALVRDRAKVILFARDWYGDITALTDTGLSFEASSKKILKTSGLEIFTKGATIQVSGSTSNNGEYSVVTSNTAYLVVDKNLTDEAAGASVTLQVLHGQKEISIGPIPGCENILAEGWIAKEDLNMDLNGGTAVFTVQGPHYWLNMSEGFISGLQHSETAPTEWKNMLDLTVDKGLWDLLHWRSTATAVMDCFLTGSTQLIPTMESSSIGSLWEQISGQARDTMLASACCDRYGRLFVEVDGQFVPAADRAFINVMTIEAYDRTGEIEVERVTVPPVDLVDLSGVWFDGTTGYGLRALAGGHIMGRFGRPLILDGLIMTDQAHCNELASLVLAQANNEYPSVNIEMPENMRLADICPQQQLEVITATDQNPRAITIGNYVFPRRISYIFDDRAKSLSVQIDSEPEVTATVNTVTGEIPVTDQAPSDDWTIPTGFLPWFPSLPAIPSLPPNPIADIPDAGNCADGADPTGPYIVSWDRATLNGDTGTSGDNIARAWLKGTIRSSGATNPTRLEFTIRNQGTSYQYLHIYGIDAGGARVATGALVLITYTDDYQYLFYNALFSLASATSIAGFELELDKGYDSVGLAAIYDRIEYQNRHGTDWEYPGGATMSLVTNSAAWGYMKFDIGGVCASTPAVLGDLFQWINYWDSGGGVVGKTLIRPIWTVGAGTVIGANASIVEGSNVPVVSGTTYEMSTGDEEAKDIGLTIATGAEQAFSLTGTMELYFLATTTLFRSVGLGPVSVFNICPA